MPSGAEKCNCRHGGYDRSVSRDDHDTLLCSDLGGSSLRVGLIGLDGAIRAMTSVPLAIEHGADGRAEVDPEVWWDGLLNATRAVAQADAIAFRAIAGVAICGMTRTQVLVDANGAPVRPAITFRDTRSADVASDIARETGVPGIDAFHPVARLAYVARHEPDRFARAAHVLDPKDYLALRLSGIAASDPISLARLVELNGRTAPIVATCLKLLPTLMQPGARLGAVQAGLPEPFKGLAGTPVFMTSNDTWTAVVGLGAMQAGCAYNVSGTSEVLGVIGTQAASAEGMMTVDWGDGLFQLGGPSQTGADVFGWLQMMLGPQAAELAAAVGDAPPHPRPLVFLPFLQGERVPHWNPDLRAAFIGLDRSHQPRDLVRAVLEGVALANRDVLTRAEQALGMVATEIRIGGGGARNAGWCQIKADICQRRIVAGCDEPGLLGCAAVALTGLGRYPSLAAAQQHLARPGKTYLPRQQHRLRYDALFDVYRRAVSAVIDLSADLAAVPRPTNTSR
jgi:xylulokinase